MSQQKILSTTSDAEKGYILIVNGKPNKETATNFAEILKKSIKEAGSN